MTSWLVMYASHFSATALFVEVCIGRSDLFSYEGAELC